MAKTASHNATPRPPQQCSSPQLIITIPTSAPASPLFRQCHLPSSPRTGAHRPSPLSPAGMPMIEVILNDRLGKKVRVKCNDDDTIGDLKKLVAARPPPPSPLHLLQQLETRVRIPKFRSAKKISEKVRKSAKNPLNPSAKYSESLTPGRAQLAREIPWLPPPLCTRLSAFDWGGGLGAGSCESPPVRRVQPAGFLIAGIYNAIYFSQKVFFFALFLFDVFFLFFSPLSSIQKYFLYTSPNIFN